MGIGDMFGFGKKEPFRVPPEVALLRTRIAAEERENYPNLARFKDLKRDATAVFKVLDGMVIRKEHAEEAGRVREDLRKRLDALEAKIAANLSEAKNEDYVEDNLEYLERKSTRNAAKTRFTEFLEAQELLLGGGPGGAPLQGDQLHAATEKLVAAIEDLRQNYFSKHGKDREISRMRDILREKLGSLSIVCRQDLSGIRSQELRAAVAENLRKIAACAADCG